jgi:hypothetical protein
MIRSAVLTLGAVMMLGGASAARADEMSLTNWPLLSPAAPTTTEVFPSVPQNWSDLPLQFHVSDTVGYNSNITNAPTGAGANPALFGRPIGAFESISTYGVSFKSQIGAQQLFGDASWGMYQYLNNDNFNTPHSSVDLGDNFTYGSKCTGALKFSEVSAPSLPGQQIGFNVVNTVTTVGLNEDAKCVITGEYAGILNSGISQSKNTATLDQLNDYRSEFVAAGISYSVSETNSLQVLATVTGTDYTNHQALSNVAGLFSNITTDQVMATYTKNFGPNLALNAQIGILGFSNSSFGFEMPKSILPQYSFSLQWTVTPKLVLTAAASRLASAPTSIVSNLQVTESASIGLSYLWTPKVTISGGFSANYSNGAITPVVNNALLSALAANQKTYSGNAGLNYAITPFLAARLSYQYTRSIQANLTTNDSLVLLALNFNPY